MAPTRADSAVAVEDRLFQALAILRVVVTINMVVLSAYRHGNFQHPTAGLVVVVVLVVWTGLVLWLYDAHSRRTPWLLVTDLAIAVAAMALTPIVKTPEFNATIPGFWVMGVVLAWAIHWHWKGGLLAGVVLSATDVALRNDVDQGTYGNIFLLLLAGPIVGYLAVSLQRMAAERDAAERAAAAAEERTRLARAVHDGVLQVLAMTQRRGAAAGGDWAELGRLAGDQERSLRSLIRQQDTIADTDTGSGGGIVDLAGALERLATDHDLRVEVATPGVPVPLPGTVASELVAVVAACLDNVRAHVGDDAPAWVLLESSTNEVDVSVRDSGPGIPDGRLEEAAQEGRLGVVSSIRGRVTELGGSAVLETGSWGTEWQVSVPVARHGQPG